MQTQLLQKWAWVYAALFFTVVLMGYVPVVTVDRVMLGVFKIDLLDDILHLTSGMWAMWAAWHSTRQSVLYFRIFGTLYCLDGIFCILVGRCLLDLTFFTQTVGITDIGIRILANAPHVLIGGIGMYLGFAASRRFLRATA